MPDEFTRREIDKVASRTLKEAGMREPPFLIDNLLDHLEIDREFFDLEDPGLIRRFVHKVKVKGKILSKIREKIKLAAVWLPNMGKRDRIYVDESLPKPKKKWASFHDATHGILEWHRPYFLGDTAETLDPDFQVVLENEANYGASTLMFGGDVFTRDALDTTPEWESIKELTKVYKTSFVTTLRRYVQHSHDIPMSIVVSIAWWDETPEDQEHRVRHFIKSVQFKMQFASVSDDFVLNQIDDNTNKRRGGPVGEFEMCLPDVNGDLHEFYAESFYRAAEETILPLPYPHRKKIAMKNFKITRRHALPVLIVAVIVGCLAVPAIAADPLRSWREGTNKQLIIEFVEKVTTPGGPSFVAPEDRVATFDMDGTILLEKPAYSLFAFAIPLIKAAAAAQPALLERPHVKAIVDGDMKYFAKAGKFGPEDLYATLLETHTGKTEAQYASDAHGFLFEQKHPRFQVPYAETVYQPMLEMIRYLEANDFRVYICSGSDVSFIRAMIKTSIGLPVENAIGTQVMTTWIEHAKGSEFRREHAFVEPVNDEKGKPVNILRLVGKRPIIAVGNSEGDRDMLEYSDDKNPATPDLQMIVNHDDPEREYEYAVEKVDHLAAENGWQVISMKKDWERVFDF